MPTAALYDIHGNLPALEAVLARCVEEDIDRIVVGGDVVPGPMPGECLARLRSLEARSVFIRGNGEREVLTVADGGEPEGLPVAVVDVLRWTAGTIAAEDLDWLRAWPPTSVVVVDGPGAVMFCHATPGSDSEIFTRRTPDEALLRLFESVEADAVVCGHTHMQFDRRVGDVRVVNAGSVGMPFGEPGAYWAKLGPDIELRHTAYDLEAAAARVRATEYPGAEAFATNEILSPRSEAEVLAAFERVAGRGQGR